MTILKFPDASDPRTARPAREPKTYGRWSRDRPSTLIVACSDGRLQKSTDEFLEKALNVTDYDRLYIPGGAGAMAYGGSEFIRAETFRRSFIFLVQSHGSEQVILLTHAATDDGPPEAVCAHYRRIMNRASVAEIRRQQERDIADIARDLMSELRGVRLRAFQADVTGALTVSFTEVTPG
jgi:hypothetical protein